MGLSVVDMSHTCNQTTYLSLSNLPQLLPPEGLGWGSVTEVLGQEEQLRMWPLQPDSSTTLIHHPEGLCLGTKGLLSVKWRHSLSLPGMYQCVTDV